MSRSWRSQSDRPGTDVKLRARPLIRGSVHVYRRNAALILGTAVVIFAPVAAFEAFFDEIVLTSARDLLDIAVLASLTATAAGVVTSILAVLFYEGLVERIAGSEHHGRPKARPTDVVKDLPYGRLIVADIVITIAVVIGFAVFVLPGVLALVYLALTTPVINIERRSVGWSLRRSYELVRGNFFRVGTIIVVGLVFAELVESGIEGVAHALHLGRIGEFFAILASDVVVEPVVALPIVMAAFLLTDIHRNQAGMPVAS